MVNPSQTSANSTPNEGNEGNEGNDDSIDDLDDLPDDDVSPAPVTGFGLYNAHEEAATW